MSRRPEPTPSRPWGSTNANKTKSKQARLARFKKHNLSSWPRKLGRHAQGFPQLGKRDKR